jgi:hypothetical protein
LYWIVDSIIDTTLNLPESLSDILVADITRCYETIPLHGPDNLLEAVSFISSIAFKHVGLSHPHAITNLWMIRVSQEGLPAIAKWATTCPRYGSWLELTLDRLILLHKWLMNNCFITLGDRIWRQQIGIPMGFSYSPIWYNMYLLSYETKFIQRLARLGRRDLMAKFQHAFRYIDDLCLLNVMNPCDFLFQNQLRTEQNPFWIYLMDVLEIKEETSTFSQLYPERGI